jgi:type IV secretory pathway TraG/TraD family ATPase VirD4
MSGQPLETARELELILGKYEYKDDENNKRTRQLLTMDEIRILKEAIILCGNLPPIKAKMIPYYEQRELKRLTSLPPYQIEEKSYDDELEEISLK